MNAIRNLEALLLREHEERITSLRGADLVKGDRKGGVETRLTSDTERDLRTQRILHLLKEEPEISNGELAFEVGISRTTLQAILRAAGVKRVAPRTNQWDAKRDELKKRTLAAQQLRAEGMELLDIAERLGCTERQVRYALSGGR